MSDDSARICLVSPATAAANNGNWQTASRWQRFLAPLAQVELALTWDGAPADALIALHARRSAESILRFHAAFPERPLGLVLTGTDLYGDLAIDQEAQQALACASHLVVLQAAALQHLDAAARPKARVIVQSAPRLIGHSSRDTFVAVGHLRAEKDPLTLFAAVRLLPPHLKIVHIGAALDAALGAAAERVQAECPYYRWLGALPHDATRRKLADATALVHASRVEGGANVIVEALRSDVAVLASRIDGNVGMLGSDYDGYFTVGDARALAALMQRFAGDAAYAAHLRAQCAARAPAFAPALERRRVQALGAELLRSSRAARSR